jgi:hypothetical protein
MILRAMLAVAYATGWASHARQVKGDDPDKKGYPGLPGWGFGMGLTTHCYESWTKEKEGYCSTGQSPQRAVVPMEKEEDILKFTLSVRKLEDNHILINGRWHSSVIKEINITVVFMVPGE